jgi:hypothetical protein
MYFIITYIKAVQLWWNLGDLVTIHLPFFSNQTLARKTILLYMGIGNCRSVFLDFVSPSFSRGKSAVTGFFPVSLLIYSGYPALSFILFTISIQSSGLLLCFTWLSNQRRSKRRGRFQTQPTEGIPSSNIAPFPILLSPAVSSPLALFLFLQPTEGSGRPPWATFKPPSPSDPHWPPHGTAPDLSLTQGWTEEKLRYLTD